jgi:carboxypeptidase family protein
MKKFLASMFFLAFVVSCLARGTSAQTVQGVITGNVTDPSGASVPNATVTLTNIGTGVSQTTTTESDGSFRFPLVPPGTYTLDVKATSFAEFRASGLSVQASQTVPFPVRLELAKGKEIIEVTEQVALVQTATSQLATQVDRTTIENASLVNRDIFATLPFLAPQVSPGLDMSPTSGGARESGTSYLLNGADNNDNFSEGGINIHPPLESVQDFAILTNSMSAEYGRGNGAVVTANQKSGTNNFHGSLYEFNRNASLNAGDFFNNASGLPKPKYVRNQFGGEIDGPIRRDKTFFSFAYDRIVLRSGFPLTGSTTPNKYVPTSTALALAQANAGPIATQILSAFPPLTSDTFNGSPVAPGALVGTVALFDPVNDTSNVYYGRVDHNISSADRISVSANIFRDSVVDKYGGGPLSSAAPTNGSTINHFHQITLNESHVFNPRLVNEATVAHNRHYNTFIAGDGTDTVPNMLIDNLAAGGPGYYLGGPFDGGLVQGFVQDRWAASDNLNVTVGKHSFKFGGGTQYGILYRNWDLGTPGNYEFSELYAPFTAAGDGVLNPDGTISDLPAVPAHSNFANDYPYFQETSIDPATGTQANAYRHYTYHDYYWFAQDDWKVTRRLTFNLGLRWDRYGAPSEVHNIIAQFTNLNCDTQDRACLHAARVNPVSRMWNTRNRDFGPRFGFAWDPFGNGKMAVRGGYGIYYDRIFDNIWSNGAWNPPFYALIDFSASCGDAIFYSNPASIGAAYDTSNPIPHPGKRVSVRTMDVNMKDSSAQNFNLSVERQFFGGLLLRAGYQGSLGRHQPMLENLNRTDGQAYNDDFSNPRPNSLYTGFNYRANLVNSSYHALVLEAQKHMGHGLEFQTGYTWSKLLDVNSELFAGCSTIGSFTAPYYFVSNAQPSMYKGPGSFDHRSAFKFNVIYELPFMKQQKGFAGQVLGGWTISSFYQFYSGHALDIYDGRGRDAAYTCDDVACSTTTTYLDQNGLPVNIGGDYNLDGVANDHPVYLGGSVGAAYSGKNPADGIFKDSNQIGCDFPGSAALGVPQTAITQCLADFGVGTPSTLFGNPAYPSGATPFERFGTLGRGVFHGPRFQELDMSLGKTFRIRESLKLQFRAQAQNILNHPSFDCVDANLSSSTFGTSQCLAQSVQGAGSPTSRVMSLGLRLAF